tara:strand:- start:6719 stop:7192 length:474 start_codon:yes stop_codon:yes gene_type:complete
MVMRFHEDIRIVSTSQDNTKNNHVHLKDRSINHLIEILSKGCFILDESRSLIGYNSLRIPKDTLRIPLRLWGKISSEKDVEPYSVHLIGSNSLLEREHLFELTLKDERGVDAEDDRYFVDLIEGSAVLTANYEDDYKKALHVIRAVGSGLVRSAYEK